MASLQIFRCKQPIRYTGSELSPHWIYRNFELRGNALVAFEGPAEVSLSEMVDLEDVKHNAPIYSPKMLHFIGEFFEDSLEKGILLQHLFVYQLYECLTAKGITLQKKGDDLFFEDRKLSVSIATKSAVSVLFHTALNIDTEGTPIPTSGLGEMQIDPDEFSHSVLEKFQSLCGTIELARVKVRPV